MKKYISLMAFCLLAVFSQVLVSCSDDGADEKTVMKAVLKNCKKVESDCEIEI